MRNEDKWFLPTPSPSTPRATIALPPRHTAVGTVLQFLRYEILTTLATTKTSKVAFLYRTVCLFLIISVLAKQWRLLHTISEATVAVASQRPQVVPLS